MLEHVERLAISPWTARKQHVERLHAAGFDDREVVRLTMLVSYLSFEHRVRLGLLAV